MRKRPLDSLILVMIAVACFALSGAMHRPLRNHREYLQRGPVLHHGEAPPLVVFSTVALGGFRGIIADAMWLRISYLQTDGRYLEIAQLAEWITKLQPSITEIWAFHAWNMAYNVSVMIPDPESRWRWVQNGIHLLRDEGRRYNANDPQIYAELGWLFQHKIGSSSDRHHAYYKSQWAAFVEALIPEGKLQRLRPRPVDDVSRQFREQLAMDYDRMRVVDAKYGPLDWRQPLSHAVYWAYTGLLHADDHRHLPCDRMIYQSLAGLALGGFASTDGITPPALHLIDRAMLAFDEARGRFDTATIDEARTLFLRDAVITLHRGGRHGQARRYYERWRTAIRETHDSPLPYDALVGETL